MENYKKVAPGNVRMLDPVGTPEKVGFEHACLDSWDLFQPNVRFRIVPGSRDIEPAVAGRSILAISELIQELR